MKKNILIIVLALILTGCTAEYTLTINEGVYSEKVSIIGDNNDETASFNNDWVVAVDKDIYNLQGDSETTTVPEDIYEYKIKGNSLTFSYDFNIKNINNSSAISNCYNVFNINKYEDRIVISTDENITCFDKNPTLNDVIVNIITDKEVLSNNADSVDGNKYIWHLTNTNSKSKSINMLMVNDAEDIISGTGNSNKKDYSMYIFCGILLLCVLIGYLIFNILKIKRTRVNI